MHSEYPFSIKEALEKEPKHTIVNLVPTEKEIEVKVIVLEMKSSFITKNQQKITQFLVADHTGSILCNFFGVIGTSISPGDILFILGAYASLFKTSLVLYQGIYIYIII